MKYMPRSVWELLWLLNSGQCLDCFCLLMNICKQGMLSSGHGTILGVWGRQTNALGHFHHKYSHLAAQHLPFCHPGGHSWAWLPLNLGIFLFPSPTVCPCCHCKQLCVCQAGFSQIKSSVLQRLGRVFSPSVGQEQRQLLSHPMSDCTVKHDRSSSLV